MKSSKFCLVLLVMAMGLWVCPRICKAIEPNEYADYAPSQPSYSLDYVGVQFEDFPFWLLRQIRNMAPAIRQEMPQGLQIGLKKKEDKGLLQFSYQESSEGVLLSMRFQHLSLCPYCTSDMDDAPLLLDERRFLIDPSDTMITDTLRELFSSFCIAWEQNRIADAETEIVSTGLKDSTGYPERISLSAIDVDN